MKEIELRDWFAAGALQGMLASWEKGNTGRLFNFDALADDAYAAADAMLKQREQI